MSFIWHGFNLDPRKRTNQCYYEPNCLVCWLRLCAFVIRLGVRYRLAEIRVPRVQSPVSGPGPEAGWGGPLPQVRQGGLHLREGGQAHDAQEREGVGESG